MPLPEGIAKLFYPASAPFHEGSLTVGNYTLPYKEYGNPKGIPIVNLHGGPGGGTKPDAYRMFDPKVFRIILYDQRGAGESTPGGGVKDNTPDNLADDMEVLRKHLGIDQWHIYGGSWGSTLALLYAEKYPKRVKSLTIYGIWLLRKQDDNLAFELSRNERPEAFRKYKKFLLPNESGETNGDIERMQEAYYQMIMNPDPAIHFAAMAAAFEHRGEGILDKDKERLLNCERINVSFERNHRFEPEDRLLRDINTIRHIPTRIIQGLKDKSCVPEVARDLKRAFPEAELEMVDAGHSVPDPELTKALKRATDNIRDTGTPLAGKKVSISSTPGGKRSPHA